MNYNWVDALAMSLLVFSAIIGVIRGVVRELLSLVIWTLALLLAWRYHRVLAPELSPWFSGETSRVAGAFGLLTLGLVMAGGLMGYLLTHLVARIGLGGTTRLLGALFGILRGTFIVAMLAFLTALTPLADQAVWRESQFVGRFQVLAEKILKEVPPEIEDLARSL